MSSKLSALMFLNADEGVAMESALVNVECEFVSRGIV